MSNKLPWYFYISWLWTIWADSWCWPLVLLSGAFQGRRIHWIHGGLWAEIRRDTWLDKRMKFEGVTLGNGGLLKEGRAGDLKLIDMPVEFHEQCHCHQFQVAQLIVSVHVLYAYLVSGANEWIFILVPFGGAISYLAAMLVAKMRGANWYDGNIFESSAYAQTTLWKKGLTNRGKAKR